MNAVQVFLGRQLVTPSAGRRSSRQLRAESAAASVAMLGASVTTFGVPAGGLWTAVGVLVLLPGGSPWPWCVGTSLLLPLKPKLMQQS
ncbi:hypothetical protein [Streptomyces griseorubiginosus]|uniref:hypothetical protein n=1 Tax=Streptomyces griseorubiginosus TaxID=67304 RepID=UPI0036EE0120